MTTGLVAALLLVAVPAVAEACATCISSAYGDRTYNLAFWGLLAMPFVVAAAIGGVLLYVHRHRRGARPWDHPIKETT
jgi:hypothetical protein